jgi:hypothetical protein
MTRAPRDNIGGNLTGLGFDSFVTRGLISMKWQMPLLVAAIIFSALNPSRAEDNGNDFLLKCSEAGEPPRPGTFRNANAAFDDGYCIGVLHGLSFLSVGPPSTRNEIRFCPPPKATEGQGLRVVLNFLRNNPARTHEQFEILILNALHEAWPCRN